MHAKPIERSVQYFSALGENGAFWVALGLGGAVADADRRRSWLYLAGSVPATIGANYVAKVIVRRKRPRLIGYKPLGESSSSLSFPSAHATTSFAAARLVGYIAPDAQARLMLVAAAMAASRVYLGMHYPSDVLAGAAAGWLLGTVFGPSVVNGQREG